MSKEDDGVWVDLLHARKRQQMRRIHIMTRDGSVWLRGAANSGSYLGGFTMRIPPADVDAVALAMRWYVAGKLGRMAVVTEARQAGVDIAVAKDPPYPMCRTPKICADIGYCKRDPACNE